MKKTAWLALIALLSAGTVRAVPRYVSTNSTGGDGQYLTWETAATNIQDAVNAAGEDDIIWVTNGTYYCGSNSAKDGYTAMVATPSRITIQSVNGPGDTIVDANYPAFTNRCFYIAYGATVSGFTITNGHTCDANNGGGVFINASGGVLTNCWITGNSITNGTTAGTGGGVYCTDAGTLANCLIYANITTNAGAAGLYAAGGSLIRSCVISNNAGVNIPDSKYVHAAYLSGECLLADCTIISNRCGGLCLQANPTVDTCRIIGNRPEVYMHRGGGIYARPGNTAVIRNSQICYNASENFIQAAGIFQEGYGLISNCVINSNYCLFSGGGSPGGILIDSSAGVFALVQDCEIIGNTTYDKDNAWGGGVQIKENGVLRNCLIANNNAHGGAGVNLNLQATDTLTSIENCTIVSNRATRSYGAVSGGINWQGSVSGGRVINTIIYSNLCYAPALVNWNTNAPGMTFSNCCTMPTNNLPGGNNTEAEPKFIEFEANNFRLAPSSPCINAGLTLDWMTGALDLDGYRRLDKFSGKADIGCYEHISKGALFGAY